MPPSSDENRRQRAKRAVDLLGREAEPAFDAVVRMLARSANVPIALISLQDDRGQWIKAGAGLCAEAEAGAFCATAIAGDAPLIVRDAAEDSRFAGEPQLRAALAAPLIARGGEVYGALCALSPSPIDWSAEQIAMIEDAAVVVADLIETRLSAAEEAARAQGLAEAHSALEQVARLAGVGGWEFEPDSGRLEWSTETRRIHETPEDFELSVLTAVDFYAPEARSTIMEAVERCIRTGEPYDLELPLITAGGRRIHVRTIGERVQEEGWPTRLRGAFQDLTEQREREEALRRAEAEAKAARERLWNAIEAIPDGFVIYDADERLVVANRRYHELYAEPDMTIEVGDRFEDILRGGLRNGRYLDAIGREEEWLAERLAQHRRPGRALEQRNSKGRWTRIHERLCDNGDVVGFRIDITEDKLAEKRLRRYSEQLASAKALSDKHNRELREANAVIARHALEDPLTGLANRRRFDEAFRSLAVLCARSGETIALLHVDLDRFKEINDSLGHAAGDEALRVCAARLAEAVRRDDLVARLGGDEFVVLGRLPQSAVGRGECEIQLMAERVVASLARPMEIEGKRCVIGASVGSVVAPGASTELSELMRAADIALYQAKKAGRGRAMRFDVATIDRRAAASTTPSAVRPNADAIVD